MKRLGIAMMVMTMAACGKQTKDNTGPSGGAPGQQNEPNAKGHVKRPGVLNKGKAYGQLTRMQFNQAAVRLNLGIYWADDSNHNKKLDPNELVSLLFYPHHPVYVKNPAFVSTFPVTYSRLVQDTKRPNLGKNPADRDRRLNVRKELDQGRPTLVYTDLTKADPQDRAFVRHMMVAANFIDRLHKKQLGIYGLGNKIPRDDSASASMFRRNWGPVCKGPKSAKYPKCTAIAGVDHPVAGIYPADIQKDKNFCTKLAARKDAKTLMSPFVVVRKQGNKLVAVPYNKAYPKLMNSVAKELDAAAASYRNGKEKALVAYLKAAAKSFRTNDWLGADEAWATMNTTNSKWYLRVAPDEVYWDPCSRKAGFHLTLAKINNGALTWQSKLNGVRQDMENTLAKLIGKPYAARKVAFHLPDFIDIVINAGNDRSPFGATIGESLPNWGPVANKGHGRTVAMTNLYTDADSLTIARRTARSVLDAASMKFYPKAKGLDQLSTILHEATHNLGPAHQYKVKGKTAPQIFGGPLASTLEELKAQTGALYFLSYLLKRKLITQQQVDGSFVKDFMWCLGHISRGMYDSAHKSKPYSQLAAIQVGFLMKQGAITFDPKAVAANGKDHGIFTLHLDKFPAAVEKLMRMVGQIKAKGDKAAALRLIKEFVDGKMLPFDLIKERILRSPKASFVYSVKI